MLQQNKSFSNSLLNFSILKKLLDIHKFRIFFLSSSHILQFLGALSKIKKSRTYARQIWKILRDKINLIDLRKGTLKKMYWEAT